MPRKYIYRKQMSGLLDFHGFREQTEEFLNGIGEDIGNLSNLTTTAKSNLVAAINEVAASGGGGAEENFQQVYTTTLAKAAQQVIITSADMQGAFIDAVVCIDNSVPLANDTEITIGFCADHEGDVTIAEYFCNLTAAASWLGTFAVISCGGLLLNSKNIQSLNYTIESGFALPGGILYPSTTAPGVALIWIGAETTIPAGTTITVYARRRVTTAE